MVFVRYTNYLSMEYFHTRDGSYTVDVSKDTEDLVESIWLIHRDGEDFEDICFTPNKRKDDWPDIGWRINGTQQLLPSVKMEFFPPLPFLTLEGYRIAQQNNFVEDRKDLTSQKVCFYFTNHSCSESLVRNYTLQDRAAV